jgi:hypothetical protein
MKDIVTAVRNCGLEYTPDFRFVGVTDEGARRFCDALLREGEFPVGTSPRWTSSACATKTSS